jgi:hypothetical protein
MTSVLFAGSGMLEPELTVTLKGFEPEFAMVYTYASPIGGLLVRM